MTDAPLDATVVVPVRDPDELAVLVAALAAQTLPRERFEVVVADDGSRVPLGIEPDGAWLRLDRAPAANSYAARNRGAGLARGRVLAFCDADCRPEPTWLEEGLAAIRGGASLAAGDVRPEPPRRVTPWALLDADESLNQRRAVAERHAVTANLFVRRETFDRLGGFDESLPSGGDYDFAERAVAAGEHLVFAPAAVVAHPTVDGARAFLRRAWFRERSHSRRRYRRGPLGTFVQLPKLVPLAGPLWARFRRGQPLWLERSRIDWPGAEPKRRTVAAALGLRYLVLPYVTAAAHIPRGWLRAESKLDVGLERPVQEPHAALEATHERLGDAAVADR